MKEYWFYAKGTKVNGPVEASRLQALGVSGELQPSDMIIRAGETQWVAAHTVSWLFVQANRTQPDQASSAAAATGTYRKKKILVALGVLLALLAIGGLGATTAFLYQEKMDLQARVSSLQTALPAESKSPPALAPSNQTKSSLAEAETEITALKDKLVKLESLRTQDAETIKDLQQRLAKIPPDEKPKKPPISFIKQKSNSYEVIDNHALQTPPEMETSLDSLASYLVKPAETEEEKARAIFRWIADRIAYDADAFFSGKITDQKAETVLRTRKGVCAGYANLFEQLGRRAGLQVAVVTGFGKGVSGNPGGKFQSNHAWNAVKIKGEWKLIEATWGAGGLQGKKYSKNFDDSYFLARPDLLILNHIPDNPKWQLLNPPLAPDTVRTLMTTDVQQVKGLLALGLVKQETLLQDLKEKKSAAWAKAWTFPGVPITVHTAPLEKQLQAGMQLRVKVEAPQSGGVAIFNNGRAKILQGQGGFFEGADTLEPGIAKVGVQLPGKGSAYWMILEYEVR